MTPTPSPDGISDINGNNIPGPKVLIRSSRKRQTSVEDDRSMDKEMEKLRADLRVDKVFGLKIYQFNRIIFVMIHTLFLYRVYLRFTGQFPCGAGLFELAYGYIGGLGVTIGCHRYWSHKSFKAKRPLEILMMIAQTIAFQHSIYKWCIDHRIHHKYTDTEMDPHNSKRGFWFSQIGWVVSPKRPELQEKLESFRLPDLEKDPVVRFQSRYYWQLLLVFHYALPMAITVYVWQLSWFVAFASTCWRHAVSIHFSSLVNSAAHMWGYKPYDKDITATDNHIVSFFAAGEGWHNYHHAFPWDYKASELGWKINLSTMVIDFFAWVGWAYDLKTVSKKSLKERVARTGNSGPLETLNNKLNELDKNDDKCGNQGLTASKEAFWGWNDERLPRELKEITTILSRKAM